MERQLVKLESVNFQELVSGKINLSIDFRSKLVERLDEYFNDNDKRWYVANFFVYLNYHPTKDYPINLEDVYKYIGFANKANAKRTLKNNFAQDEDYKVVVIPRDENLNDKGGRPEEDIMLNIDTFKNLCMLAKTQKGKEIRKYYTKLENIFNDIVNEQQIEYESKLKITQQMLDEKEKNIENLQKKPPLTLYIGHNPLIKNQYKVGITEDAYVREESHKSSNPNFQLVFRYESENAKSIESMVKLLMKPFKVTKPEWFNVTYDQLKTVFDFAVLMYDTYLIHESPVNLNEFVNRYNSNRLVHSNKARCLIEHSIYEEYMKDCVEVKPGKVTSTLLCEDFFEWLTLKYPEKAVTSHIKLNTGNWSTEFQREFMSVIAKSLNVEYKKISLINKKRNYNFNNVSGFVGLELKSMNKHIDFFEDVVYAEYVNEFTRLTNDPTNKVARVEVLEHFLQWVKQKGYVSKNNLYGKKNVATVFQDVFVAQIQQHTGAQFKEGVCKLKFQGCFIGLVHKEFCCNGNTHKEPPKITDEDKKRKMVISWLNADNNDCIAQLFRLTLKQGYVSFDDVKRVFKKKHNYDITANRRKIDWYLVFEKNEDKKCFMLRNEVAEIVVPFCHLQN